MITFMSDFESGNGKGFHAVGTDRYRMEVVGDKPVYNRYFCFELHNAGPAADIQVEIHPDPLIPDVDGFISHFPCAIWMAPGDRDRYQVLPAERLETCADHLVIRLQLAAGAKVRLADMWPCSYAATCRYLAALAAERPDRCAAFSLGRSFQGRDIAGLRAGTPGRPRVMCIAGQHPCEYSGPWGLRAIADFMSSRLPEAESFRKRFFVEIIPMVNPDGSVMGRNGFNAEGFDMYQAFGGIPDADYPQAHESRLLWRHAVQNPLALWLNVHNFLGWRESSEPPFDGWYEVPQDVFKDSAQAALNETLKDLLRLETDAQSTHLQPMVHAPDTMCWQLAARRGVPSVFYEVNGSTGGAFQSARRVLKVFQKVLRTLSTAG